MMDQESVSVPVTFTPPLNVITPVTLRVAGIVLFPCIIVHQTNDAFVVPSSLNIVVPLIDCVNLLLKVSPLFAVKVP